MLIFSPPELQIQENGGLPIWEFQYQVFFRLKRDDDA